MVLSSVMKKILISILVLLIIVILNIPKKLPSLHLSIDNIPENQLYNGSIISNDGTATSPFLMTIKKTSEILSMVVKNDHIHFSAKFDPSFSLISEKESIISSNEMQRYTRKQITFDDQSNKQPLLTFYNGLSRIKEKKIKIEGPYELLSSSSLIPYLQAATTVSQPEFYIEWLLPNVFWTQKLHVKRTQIQSLAEIKTAYKIPPKINDLFNKKFPMILFTLKPVGLSSFFMNETFYYLYSVTSPQSFIATWGGPKQHVMYQVIP
jgi:hypothetical protein